MIQYGIRTNISEVTNRYRRDFDDSQEAIRSGVRKAWPLTDNVLKSETRQRFKVRDPRMDRSWRIFVPRDRAMTLVMMNLMRGFSMHVEGGTIAPRGGEALLIPINTRGGSRISTKKFYTLVDYLRREKLTVVRNNILYVRVPTNRTGRGGIAKGTRVQKVFRTRFQGTERRPSGFDILFNRQGGYSLTPIAVVKRSISLRSRFDMDRIVRARIIPIILDSIRDEMRRLR